MLQVALISAPPSSSSGNGNYTRDLAEFVNKTDELSAEHLFFNSNCLNPFHYVLFAYRVSSGDSDVIHLQHDYIIYGPKSIYSLLFFSCLFLFSRIYRKPVVITVHEALNKDLIEPPLAWFKRIYIRLINEFICITATELVFLSDCCLTRFGKSVSINNYVRIEHGVIPERQISDTQEEAKRRFNYEPEETVVVEPGYVNPRKGSHFFLELSDALPEYEFLLAGGPQTVNHEPYFEQLVSEWGDKSNVQITGKLEDELFHASFVAADLVVLPYLEIDSEGITHKVNQSGIFNLCATYGVPTATSDQARFRNLKEEWSCVEVFPANRLELTTECIKTSVASDRANELHQSIEIYRAKNSLPAVACEHRDLYHSVVSN